MRYRSYQQRKKHQSMLQKQAIIQVQNLWRRFQAQKLLEEYKAQSDIEEKAKLQEQMKKQQGPQCANAHRTLLSAAMVS